MVSIPEQLEEHFAHRREQQLRHRCPIPAPQRVEFVRDREDEVVVRAVQQPRALALKPPLGGQALALRADPLMARVVERALAVSFGAAAQVSAQLRRAAARDPVRGAVHIRGQAVALRVRFKVFLEDPSQIAFHVLQNARPAFTSTSRSVARLPRRSRARATCPDHPREQATACGRRLVDRAVIPRS